MDQEKVKAFAEHILEECAQEGLTIAEALRVPQELQFAIRDLITEHQKQTKITLP